MITTNKNLIEMTENQKRFESKKKKRPLGVIILGIIITLSTFVYIYLALYIFNVGLVFRGIFVITAIVALIILILGIMRFFVGIGLLKMKRKAWRSALFIIIIGMILDIFQKQGGSFVFNFFLLIYLFLVKKHFR